MRISDWSSDVCSSDLVAHMAPELYLQTMVMGGVFERFPRLRFGIIEFGAGWVGPAVERMDIWVDFQAKLGVKYAMRPSEYLRRNVRVTPFWHEDLTLMVDRFGLKEDRKSTRLNSSH